MMPTVPAEEAVEPWSELDLVDLQSGLVFGTPIEEIADFLVREVEDVRRKAAALNAVTANRGRRTN
jgi:hypothetical protein